MKEKNKKLIAISFVLFMVFSGFSVLATWNGFPSIPSSTSGSGNTGATPQLSNVGETAGISTSVNYYVQSPLANMYNSDLMYQQHLQNSLLLLKS